MSRRRLGPVPVLHRPLPAPASNPRPSNAVRIPSALPSACRRCTGHHARAEMQDSLRSPYHDPAPTHVATAHTSSPWFPRSHARSLNRVGSPQTLHSPVEILPPSLPGLCKPADDRGGYLASNRVLQSCSPPCLPRSTCWSRHTTAGRTSIQTTHRVAASNVSRSRPFEAVACLNPHTIGPCAPSPAARRVDLPTRFSRTTSLRCVIHSKVRRSA